MTGEQYRLRRAVLECLRPTAEFTGLSDTVVEAAGGYRALLRWLDESGLALYLWQQFARRNALSRVSPSLRESLNERITANGMRTGRMLGEFERVNSALKQISITYAVVKGFALGYEFCDDPRLRHQCDIDLLVAPESVAVVQGELLRLGYRVESAEPCGEVRLAIRSDKVPTADEYLYAGPHHWHVEIHPLFWETVYGVSLRVGEDWALHIEQCEIEGVRYPRLNLEYRFLNQVLHVFRHTSSWLRVSWLYEISSFVEQFRDAHDFWERVNLLTRNDSKLQNACGVVCRMVTLAFGTRFPELIQKKWIEPLAARQVLWIERHAERWMLQDFTSAEKSGFLLQREFADTSWTWWRFRLGRYMKFLTSIVQRDHSGPLLLKERVCKHAKFVMASLRWNMSRWADFERPKK